MSRAWRTRAEESVSPETLREELEILRERHAALKREFENFTYIISHDLQAPLRSVVNFSAILRERYEGAFDEKGKKYFGYVIENGRTMQEMVDGLLRYSRIHTRGRPFAPAALEGIFGRAESLCAEKIRRTGARIRRQDFGLGILCDDGQMAEAFAAILDNALKFQPPGNTPDIEIAAGVEGGVCRISIRDNGIGLPLDKSGEIFNIFRRLNRPSDYPGIGMGLALAKRIAERHGGGVAVESEPGKGAAFHLTLPWEGAP